MTKTTPRHPSAGIANRICRWLVVAGLIGPLLLTGAASHAETYYKWLGDNGTWVYGAHPPADKEAIEIKTTVTKAVSANTQGDAVDPQRARGALEVEFEEKRKKSKQQNAEYCTTARSNLEALSSKAVIRRRDAEGNITIVSEKERTVEMENAQLAIERYCG